MVLEVQSLSFVVLSKRPHNFFFYCLEHQQSWNRFEFQDDPVLKLDREYIESIFTSWE